MSVGHDDLSARFQDQSRLAFGAAVTDLARQDPRVVALSADTVDLIGLRQLMQDAPDRVLETGIAEQNTMGIASGLATVGMRPHVCGYAPFITARSMEQLRNDVAYARQPVVIGAACSGISLGVSGGTHHAVEDLALMRAMPNMTVLVPADPMEAYLLTIAAADRDGPVYVRLGGRVPEPPVTPPDTRPEIGRAQVLEDGTDVTVIACGCLVTEALAAARDCSASGLSVRVINMHSIKPLDSDAVLAAAAETGRIVTAEEHRLPGGLGSAVAELLARRHPVPMRFVALPDSFAVVGPTDQVRARYGLTAAAIAGACRELVS